MSPEARARYDAAMEREVDRRRKLGLNLHGPLQFKTAKSFYGWISMLDDAEPEVLDAGKQVEMKRVFDLYEKLPLGVQAEVTAHPAFIKIASVALALYGMGKLDLDREQVQTWKALFANSRNAHSHDWDRREGDARLKLKALEQEKKDEEKENSPEAMTRKVKNAEIFELVPTEDEDG